MSVTVTVHERNLTLTEQYVLWALTLVCGAHHVPPREDPESELELGSESVRSLKPESESEQHCHDSEPLVDTPLIPPAADVSGRDVLCSGHRSVATR